MFIPGIKFPSLINLMCESILKLSKAPQKWLFYTFGLLLLSKRFILLCLIEAHPAAIYTHSDSRSTSFQLFAYNSELRYGKLHVFRFYLFVFTET